MDFFQFASYAEFFIPTYMDADGEVSNLIWIALLVGGLCFLIVYIFQAVGLYTIATRAGYKNRWMAFVPFFNLYYIGVCAQKNKVYNLNSKNFAIIAASLEVITVLGYVLYYVALFTVWKYISWNTTTIEGSNVTYLYPSGFSADMPASLNWLGWVYLHLSDYVLSWLKLVFIVVKLLPLTGILIFAVRNNAGMSYSDYIRKVREQNYRMYQQQYGNPYNQNYNQNPYQGGYDNSGSYGGPSGAPAEDPFDEYGSSSGSSAGSSGGQSDSSSNSGSGSGSGGSSGGGSPFDDF